MGILLLGQAGVVQLANRKVQVGLNPDGSTYKNLMLTFNFSDDLASTNYPLYLNVDQYPTGVIGTNIAGSIQMPSNMTTSTVFTIAWTGTVGLASDTGGGLGIGGGGGSLTVVEDLGGVVVGGTSFSIRMAGTNGKVKFKFNAASTVSSGATVIFASGANFGSGGTQFKNLILCKDSDYASVVAATDPTQYFNSDYLAAVKGLSPKTIRLLGFIGAVGIHTQHRYRPGWNTALSFSTTYWIPNCWAGVTRTSNNITNPAADGLTFIAGAATDTPIAYTAGEVIQGQFAVSGAASGVVTINVGGRGAVPMLNVAGFAQDPTLIVATQYTTLIYDDILGGYLRADPGNPGYGWTGSNTPLELQVGLANVVGCNLWYQMCAHNTVKNSTMEGGSNSISQQVALLSSSLTNGCYLEYGNEIWNFAAPFGAQTSWASQCSLKFGMGSANPTTSNSFYGYKLATIMPIAKAAWGARSGLVRVSAHQLGMGVGDQSDLYRMAGTLLAPNGVHTGTGNATWNSYTGSADFTQAPNRPVDVCESISYAPYYAGGQFQDFESNWSNAGGTGLTTAGQSGWTTGVIGAADAFHAGGTTNINNALAFMDWDFRQGTNNGVAGGLTLASLVAFYTATEAVAAEYDATRGSLPALTIDTYEGSLGSVGLFNLCSAFALGLTTTTTATIATGAGGSGTQISWTGHGLDNGTSVGFNVSITDTNSLTVPAYPINTGQTNNTPGGVIFLYVINAQPNSFDISYTPGGTPVNIASVGGGTQTAWGSNYCGASGEADRLSLLLKAYKQSSNFQATVKSQYDTQFTYSHTSTVVWFTLNGAANANPWTMFNGDVYASVRYKSYDAVAAYHS
jgi:hypothetical protein